MKRNERIYGKQMICKGCGKPSRMAPLLNVYTECSGVERPHLELVCDCGYGNLIFIKEKQLNKIKICNEITKK